MNKKDLTMMDMVYIAAFILIFLSLLCRSDNLQLTQTKPLVPKDTLISEGGDFALGFFSPTNSSKNLYLGIWYHRIAERTVVWVANRDNPITTPSAKLAITNNSELVLSDSKGHTLWTTATRNTSGDGGTAGASAVLLSSGNFVLRSPNGTEVWQSFDHPTDNVLPSMRVTLGYKGQPATYLFAWKGPDDPSTGVFSLGLDPNSNLQLFIWKGEVPYFRFPVVNDNPVSGAMNKINGIDVILYQTTINTADESYYYMYTVSPGSPYTRLSLDYTGKGRLLTWKSTTSSWAAVIEVPAANSCDLYASCGPFGYCDRAVAIPTCRCPDGFELLDSLNFSRGCRRRETLRCGKEEDDYFMAMPNMKLPYKFLHVGHRSLEQCAAECTRNCSCMAYAYANLSNGGVMGDTSRCLVWHGDLIDMEKQISEEVLYIRLGKSPHDQNKINLLNILLPIIASVLLLALGALVWAYISTGKRQKKRRMLEYLNSMDESGDKNITEFPFISLENIVTATDNFSDSNMIGKGGFGKVYKGMLEGTKEVAVKRLSKGSRQGTEEFKNEVVLIAKLQHKNLVKLLGCCIHEDERLLVYEYLPNKSLDYFLFESARKSMLQWPGRFKIIQGVARGIMYLHHDSRLTVIHRDLKSSNILLDKEMSPKISDFGMAKIFGGDDDQLQANTNRVVGTYGYMSPEYAMEGTFSVKSDTYSFGVLMLEIVSGLKISSGLHIMDFSSLISYAWNIWKEGKMEDLVDSSIMESCSLDEVSRCIHIALLCVQDNPSCRPLMSAVVFMLENKMTPLPTPKQPMYFRNYYQPGKAVDNKQLSINDVSLTVLEGR